MAHLDVWNINLVLIAHLRCVFIIVANPSCVTMSHPYSYGGTIYPIHPLRILVSFYFSGTISITELKDVMKRLGQNPTDDELQRMVLSVDDNGDNEIDFQEFLILMSSNKPSKEDPDRELRDAFKVFDSDGSGSISRIEMKKLLKRLGQNLSDAELDAMMDEVDTDGNGEIDFEEFKSMMVRHPRCFHLPPKICHNFTPSPTPLIDVLIGITCDCGA